MTALRLNPLAGYAPFGGPVVVVVMDGVGIGPEDESNGVHVAYTPTLDALFREELMLRLKAHGKAVGLPSDDDMGNSEVGHNAQCASTSTARMPACPWVPSVGSSPHCTSG